MPHRAHVVSLRIGHALREALSGGYRRADLARDVLAGLTVGIIAIPLAMALAIASGVAPQYGLYTAMIAGVLIAVLGGSRYSISGPTAAFVVILYPLVAKHGLAGLLLATTMAGLILIAMAYARLGRFIEYIPESVTLGFTGGIAIVIATLQVPDFTGLVVPSMPEHYLGKIHTIAVHLGQADAGSCLIAVFTLTVMLAWPRLRLRLPVPPLLPALLLASLLGVVLGWGGMDVETIGTRFHSVLPNGSEMGGMPPFLPTLDWPWHRPGPDGEPLALTLELVSELLPAAFAIAVLGAIESLLCAVVLDGMSGKRHSANSELLAQGVGNLETPFFGGITATAAIARSATNFRAGAVSPLAALTHALAVFAGLLLLSRALAWIPMPALAALLMVVAWNMSEAPRSVRLIKRSPRADVLVFVTCLSLTVLFDMVIAITAGVVLASLLFMKELAGLTRIVDISGNSAYVESPLPENWKVFKVRGAMFFAAADRIAAELSRAARELDGIVLHMQYSSYLDAGGMSALERLMDECAARHITVRFSAWQFQPLKAMAKARNGTPGPLDVSFPSLEEAIRDILTGGRENAAR
ncbi:C4-dicarboxylic acid transporter DauA [Parahaliea maris]|uniref:C4-dicarboxylic acid transporter DauA n=1 Tax=Parahaliea maris TaxID=2716870 RepID=A0A5C9A8E2_9GAMM|nr:C4-dicarboxylic acid transporter DauA [Parahaliea maris]TXS95827.1 C4-dicarboxylic acid transporter DauA [Parahaliea maris]